MAMTDARKQTVNLQLAVACYIFETGLPLIGGPTLEQSAALLTAGLAEIAADSTDVPQGLDFRATLLAVEGLASLNSSVTGGYGGVLTTAAASAAALL